MTPPRVRLQENEAEQPGNASSVPDVGGTSSTQAFTAATPVKKLCSEGSTICMSSLLSGVTEVASEAEDDNQQPPRTARGGGTAGPRAIVRSSSEEALLMLYRERPREGSPSTKKVTQRLTEKLQMREEDVASSVAWQKGAGGVQPGALWKTVCGRVGARRQPPHKRVTLRCSDSDDLRMEDLANKIADHLKAQYGLLEVAIVAAALEIGLCSDTQVTEHILQSLYWKIYKSRWPEKAPSKECIDAVAQEVLSMANYETIQEVLPSIHFSLAKLEEALGLVFMVSMSTNTLQRLHEFLDTHRFGTVDLRRLAGDRISPRSARALKESELQGARSNRSPRRRGHTDSTSKSTSPRPPRPEVAQKDRVKAPPHSKTCHARREDSRKHDSPHDSEGTPCLESLETTCASSPSQPVPSEPSSGGGPAAPGNHSSGSSSPQVWTSFRGAGGQKPGRRPNIDKVRQEGSPRLHKQPSMTWEGPLIVPPAVAWSPDRPHCRMTAPACPGSPGPWVRQTSVSTATSSELDMGDPRLRHLRSEFACMDRVIAPGCANETAKRNGGIARMASDASLPGCPGTPSQQASAPTQVKVGDVVRMRSSSGACIVQKTAEVPLAATFARPSVFSPMVASLHPRPYSASVPSAVPKRASQLRTSASQAGLATPAVTGQQSVPVATRVLTPSSPPTAPVPIVVRTYPLEHRSMVVPSNSVSYQPPSFQSRTAVATSR